MLSIERAEMESKKHFVLVHGACHGAWCWYKLVCLLKLAGHQVTAMDLGACGVDPKQLKEIPTFSDYVQPLMEVMASLPPDEKIILIGHSYGGFPISFAMEKFPEKILVAVFVSAHMPNCSNPPSTILEEYFKWIQYDDLHDCEVYYDDGPDNPPTSSFCGPEHLTHVVYTHCSTEDMELGKLLVRPTGIFWNDLSKKNLLTTAKFGSVDRVFVFLDEDLVIKNGFQNWLVSNSPPNEVKVISESGHMAMFSKAKQLCQCLLNIAEKYN